MTILRQDRTDDDKIFRLVEKTYVDNDNQFFDIFTYEYKIQIKVLFFWITIKSYDYTFDSEMDNNEIYEEIDYNKFLAEEYYEFIINN